MPLDSYVAEEFEKRRVKKGRSDSPRWAGVKHLKPPPTASGIRPRQEGWRNSGESGGSLAAVDSDALAEHLQENPRVNSGREGTGGGWLTRERALVMVLALVTSIALYICYRLALPFLPALAWALALAVVTHPLHSLIERRVKRPNVAAAAAVAVVAAIIIAPAFFVARRAVSEAARGVEAIRAGIEAGWWRATVERNPRLAPALRWLEEEADLRDAAEGVAATIPERISQFVAGSVWAAAELLITLFALFYFFRDRRAMLRALRRLVPLSERETDEVFQRVQDTVHATIYGTLVVAIVQGALGGLMFWWLGLPAALLWGVVMALLAVVPVLGAFVVWVPAAIYLALQGSWGKALVLAAWGGIVIALIDNLLYPVLVGNKLRVHTLPVFIATVGGLFVFGASGLILGPVTLAVTLALMDIWRRRTAGGRPAEAGVTDL